MKMTFFVRGMHCASCAGLIEENLKEIEGVSEARVEFASQKADVTFDEAQTSLAVLFDAVRAAGYTPEESPTSHL